MKTASEMRVIYLHGFASSPASRKARFFVERLAGHGVTLEALDLAPDFEHLTISGQLAVVEKTCGDHAVILIGSSLGGYLAALYASRHPQVERMLLLAPAFDFHQLWAHELGSEKLEQWRENGAVSIFHYGLGKEAPLGYQLMEDAREYPPFPEFTQPCLILHGLKDSIVPFEQSARFAARHANVVLVPLDAGHEMTEVLDDIWRAASTFLLA